MRSISASRADLARLCHKKQASPEERRVAKTIKKIFTGTSGKNYALSGVNTQQKNATFI